jgi:hypothetical protein
MERTLYVWQDLGSSFAYSNDVRAGVPIVRRSWAAAASVHQDEGFRFLSCSIAVLTIRPNCLSFLRLST